MRVHLAIIEVILNFKHVTVFGRLMITFARMTTAPTNMELFSWMVSWLRELCRLLNCASLICEHCPSGDAITFTESALTAKMLTHRPCTSSWRLPFCTNVFSNQLGKSSAAEKRLFWCRLHPFLRAHLVYKMEVLVPGLTASSKYCAKRPCCRYLNFSLLLKWPFS